MLLLSLEKHWTSFFPVVVVVLFVITFSWQGGRFVGDQWMAEAVLFCSVGTAFIRPINTDSKIECRSDSREYHLYWRCNIYIVN